MYNFIVFNNKGKEMSSQELIKLLIANGWRLDRVHGSHHVFVKDGNRYSIPIPHPKKDLPMGTVRDIKKKAGIR